MIVNMDSQSEARVTLRERFRAATRDAILEAAGDLLTADGASHARMEDIAARAGVAVGTVYNHFADRTALVTALLESRTRTLLDALDAATAPSRDARDGPGGFAAELARFVSALERHFEANRFLITVLLDEERHRGIDARAATRRRTTFEELLARAETLAAKGIRLKALRKNDPAVYAALLIGMVRGMAMTALARGGSFAGASEAIVQVFLEGAAR
jgi:AcrR family transcriptional regulator